MDLIASCIQSEDDAETDLTKKKPPGNFPEPSKTIVLYACASHKADVFFTEKILDVGVPVDIPNLKNNSALHLAALRRSYDLARLF